MCKLCPKGDPAQSFLAAPVSSIPPSHHHGHPHLSPCSSPDAHAHIRSPKNPGTQTAFSFPGMPKQAKLLNPFQNLALCGNVFASILCLFSFVFRFVSPRANVVPSTSFGLWVWGGVFFPWYLSFNQVFLLARINRMFRDSGYDDQSLTAVVTHHTLGLPCVQALAQLDLQQALFIFRRWTT